MSLDVKKPLPAIRSEEDAPLDTDSCITNSADLSESPIPEDDVKKFEAKQSQMNWWQKFILRERIFNIAQKLIVVCLIFLLITYIVDTVFINIPLKTSTYMDTFIELAKFLLSTSVGFVFSNKLIEHD